MGILTYAQNNLGSDVAVKKTWLSKLGKWDVRSLQFRKGCSRVLTYRSSLSEVTVLVPSRQMLMI